jgi:hypothetical protein
MNYVGIYAVLAGMPIWLIAIVAWLATDGVIHFMRDRLEGLAYQTAWSAKFGDAGLLTAILIAATILQRGSAYVPLWLGIGWLQVAILAVCVALGFIVWRTTHGVRSAQAADAYHDLVIGPAILFFAVTLLPVIWFNAQTYEAIAVIVAIAIWAALICVDVKEGRMNQRRWLVNHGFAIKGGAPQR